MSSELSVFMASIGRVNEIEEALIQAGGEMNAELEIRLDELNLDFAASVDACSTMIERIEVASDYWSNKAAHAAKISKGLERAKEFIRLHVKDAMINGQKKEIKGVESRFVLSRTKPKLVIDETVLPDLFKKEKIAIVPNKALIESELEKGIEIPGAQFEPSFALRSYPNKMERSS